MNAEVARIKAEETNLTGKNSQLIEITHQIEKAASQGQYSIWFYKSIKSDVKDQLKKWGYKVSDQSDNIRNETLIKIDWSK